MTDPMTDRELAGCALSEVLALLEKATPGEWSHAAEYGWNIATDNYDPMSRVGASVGMALWPKDAYAICASVNFLRQHGPALLAALSTPSSEGDGIPQVEGLTVEREAGALSQSGERFPDLFVIRLGDREDCVIKGEQPALWAMFDAAIAAAAGGGDA